MRNKHKFKMVKEFKCPYNDCGKTFTITITVEYITNQRGDVIKQRII